jgi:hypothetical protein
MPETVPTIFISVNAEVLAALAIMKGMSPYHLRTMPFFDVLRPCHLIYGDIIPQAMATA